MRAVWVIACAILGGPAVAAAEAGESTLKDLGGATIRPGEQAQPDLDRARQLYRELLEMGADDPRLQTEALRRLGDMEMELGDALRG